MHDEGAAGMTNELERVKSHNAVLAEAAHYWMARAQEAEAELLRTSIALTMAAGGEIFVSAEVRQDAPFCALIREDDFIRDGHVFRVCREEAVRASNRPPSAV